METTDAQPPKSREQLAMDKLTDPFSEPYPYFHVSFLRNLSSIMKNGLVAGEFADKAKLGNHSLNIGSSWNRRYISLSKRPVDQVWEWGGGCVGILVKPSKEPILANQNLKQINDMHSPHTDEYLIEHRVAPREIVGIVTGSSDQGQFKEITLEDIKEKLRESEIDLSIPIYNALDGLIWPERLTREELKDRVQSQV